MKLCPYEKTTIVRIGDKEFYVNEAFKEECKHNNVLGECKYYKDCWGKKKEKNKNKR